MAKRAKTLQGGRYRDSGGALVKMVVVRVKALLCRRYEDLQNGLVVRVNGNSHRLPTFSRGSHLKPLIRNHFSLCMAVGYSFAIVGPTGESEVYSKLTTLQPRNPGNICAVRNTTLQQKRLLRVLF